MLALAFLNPFLLWAVPLCAVPIIIHLLNRRRFKIVPWAAMEYLLAAMKRNRKRLRMEQWLVLLLRTLAVLLLALLVARPQLSGGALLGSVAHHVILLDDTASMQQRGGSANLFTRAQDRLRTLVDRLAQTRNGDFISIVRTSALQQPDLWEARITPESGTRIGQQAKEWLVRDVTVDFGEAFAGLRKRATAGKEAGRIEYYLVSDLRRVDWLTADEKPRPEILKQFAELADNEHVTAVTIGGQDQINLAVTGVTRSARVAMAGVPTTLAVEVTNFGLDPAPATEVAIEVDGKSRVVRPIEPLAPTQRVTIPITHTFHSPGFHRVEASLPANDLFPLDDRRAAAIDIKERSRVLIVDGEPGETDENNETYFLTIALDPGGEAVSGIEVQTTTETALAGIDLKPYDMVWLCNVPHPTEADAKALEAYVQQGGGAVIYPGAQVDPNVYNDLFHKAGAGLLPLPYGDVSGDPDRPDHVFLAHRDHPIVRKFPELLDKLLSFAVLVKRHLVIETPDGHQAAVIARINDIDGSPVLVTRTFGSGGEVVQFGITADKHWSNWPDTYVNLVILQEIHRFAARVHDLSDCNQSTDGTFRLALDPGIYKADVTVRAIGERTDERGYTALSPAPATDAPAGTVPPLDLKVALHELTVLGAYEVELNTHGGVVEKRVLARSLAPRESNLVRMTQPIFHRAFPTEVHEKITFVDDDAGFGGSSGEGELWRILTAFMLAFLLLESTLAWRFGRR